MNAGPDEKAMGGKDRIVRRSYIFTRGSGIGRDCLENPIQCGRSQRMMLPTSHPNQRRKQDYLQFEALGYHSNELSQHFL